MPKLKDLCGQQFGRLVVLTRGPNKGRSTTWLCRCSCGAEKLSRGRALVVGDTQSCGCLLAETGAKVGQLHVTHGGSGLPEYRIWKLLRGRCHNKKSKDFPNYGGRGIKVSDSWNSFSVFLSDMGSRPSSSHTLERKDVNGDYCAENCIWASRLVQANNKRNNVTLTFNGETLTQAAWCRRLGITPSSLTNRLKKWPFERVFTTPQLPHSQRPKGLPTS